MTFVSPLLTASISDHAHRRDIRCFLAHESDTENFEDACSDLPSYFLSMADQIAETKPFVLRALAACKHPVVILSACARIPDSHVLELTMRRSDLQRFKDNGYMANLACATYGVYVDTILLNELVEKK